MYNTVKQYYDFLRKQEEERQAFLEITKNSVIEQMDVYMSNHGWTRMKGKSKIRYTKKFNGKDIVVEYRCNYKNDFNDGGLPEFVHDKSIPNSIEKIRMGYFHWNEQDTSGWSLDEVMDRMEKFYENY